MAALPKSSTLLRVLLFVVAAAFGACSLNPQPFPPGATGSEAPSPDASMISQGGDDDDSLNGSDAAPPFVLNDAGSQTDFDAAIDAGDADVLDASPDGGDPGASEAGAPDAG